MAKKSRPKIPRLPPSEGDLIFDLKATVLAQIEGAIDLLIRHDNHVGAHLLTSTALNNIWNAARVEGKNLPTDLSRYMRENNPAKEKILMAVLNAAHNEMRHVSGDSFSTHFHPKMTESNILNASVNFVHYFGTTSPKLAIFCNWMMHKRPELRGPFYEDVAVFDTSGSIPYSAEERSDAKKLLENHERDPDVMNEMIELVLRVRDMKKEWAEGQANPQTSF